MARLVISKAQLNSVQMQLAQNLGNCDIIFSIYDRLIPSANYKMAGTLQKSAQIMGMMNKYEILLSLRSFSSLFNLMIFFGISSYDSYFLVWSSYRKCSK